MRAALARYLPSGGRLDGEVWARRHRGVTVLLWGHAVAIPIFALVRGYGLPHSLLESSLVPLTAMAASWRTLMPRTRTMAATLGLLTSSAVLVHLSGGLIEMHFHFFVMLAVISLYQDWLPYLTAIAYVVLHHGVMGALDPESVFNHPAAIAHPWRWAGVHAFFIAGISAASLVNWRLNEQHVALRLGVERRLVEQTRVVSRLNEIGRHLASDFDTEHVVQQVTDAVTELTSAEFGAFFYNVTDENGRSYLLHALAGASAEAFAQYPTPRATKIFGPTFDGAGPVRLDDVTQDPRYGQNAPYDGMPPGHPPVRSYLAVPVKAGRVVLGGLFLGHTEIGRFDEEDERIAIGIADQAAIAVRNAQSYSAQRKVAETLQHSFLPDALPQFPGLQTAARYHAGARNTEVGGDWYDVLALPDGTIGLVVGDVIGRGIAAATTMSQLRSALRAFAMDGHPPSTVLKRLDRLVQDLGADNYVGTLVYAVFDQATDKLTVASAGHPPVLIRRPDGATVQVHVKGLPLGVSPTARYHEAVELLSPGSALFLYSDGLVEDRRRPVDHGITRLEQAIRSAPTAQADDACSYLLSAMTDGRVVDDDVALLTLHNDPLTNVVSFDVPSNPAILQPLRARMGRWLREAGVSAPDTFDIIVAVGEIASNVIRHAPTTTDAFEVHGVIEDDVSITIRNRGPWRAPRPDAWGGRGLGIVRELVSDCTVTSDDQCTTVTLRRSVDIDSLAHQ